MIWLKQSTAVTVPVGPFVDSTDGATPETALTIAQADIRLSKNGGTFAQTNNATGASHMENGWYGVPLDTTDTNTLGALTVNVNESGALQAWVRCMVVPANVWDSLFGADLLQIDETNLATAAALATVAGYIDTEVAAIKAKTDNLPSDPADASDIAAAFGVVGSAIAGLNDLSSGDVETAVGAALATYDPPTKAELDTAVEPLTTGVVVSSIATNGIAPSSFQAGSITSNALAQNAAYEIADAVMARGDIDGFTMEEFAKLVLAALAGKLSGAGTGTEVIRAADDSKGRITATVDEDGNRSAITLDATG